MKYPYIGEYRNPELTVLFTCNDSGCEIGSNEYHSDWSEVKYTNITHEYLSNTWGVVESKEHAEFIVELAELHGFKFDSHGSLGNFFTINNNAIYFYSFEVSIKRVIGDRRKITIPLPPKAKADFSDLPKHFDCICNKCGGKCCTGFCDDWKIGDDALMMSGKCKIAALADKHGNLAVTNEFGFNLIVNKSEIKKPKSKQDILIEELQTKLCNNNAADNYILACDIINGEIEGLSYE